MVGSFTDAQTAAVARLTRGAPQVGWALTDGSGIAAPTWVAPNFPSLVSEVNSSLLDQLMAIVKGFASDQQAAQTISIALPPPANSSGQSMGGAGSTTTLAPLVMTLMAASTDPFLSLVLGFGTAYPPAGGGVLTPAVPLDFMVTARWEQGLDGKSAPADYAAVIAAPAAAPAPPPPANMFTEIVGALRPLAADGNWRSTLRIGWDRPPITPLFRTASLAATRASITPCRSQSIKWRTRRTRNSITSIWSTGKSRSRPTPARANSPTRRRPGHLWAMDAVDFGRPEPRSPTSSRFGS
jgi:hypothetical protein